MSEGMKATGIQWIGDIPVSWNTKRIKYMASLKGRIGWQGLTSEEYQDEGAYLITGVDFKGGGIDWENCYHVPMKRWEEAKEIQIQNGDLLITKDGTIGKVAIVSDMPGEASLNSGVLRIMPIDGYNQRFLFWVIQSAEFWNWFNFRNSGNSTIIHLYQGDFAEFNCAFPDYREQEAIADYLDKQCGKLDEIIADLYKQIDILQKYKKSVITEAVTKGLNKDAAMKDSGVEWIGKVPEHWHTIRLKYVFSVKSGDAIINELLNEGDVPVYGGGKQMGTYPKCNVSRNTLLIGRVGANCGCVTLVKENAWATDNALVAKTVHYIPYIYYLLQIIDLKKDGDSSAQPLVTGGKIGNTVSAFTFDIGEQQNIVTYLNKECSKIDNVIQSKEDQLDVIQQHKQSLIFEYVTGKKRVKEV